MKRVREQTLGTILRQYLREEGLETPLNEHRVVSCWSEVMGEVVARYTTSVQVRGGILYVSLTNPALRQNLMMMRSKIVQKLNAHVGAQVLQNVVIR